MSEPSSEWSDDARSALITGGRQLAEAVLIHIEKLERLRGDDDLDAVDASTEELGHALDRFEDIQLAYCGTGLPYLDLNAIDGYEDAGIDDLDDDDLDEVELADDVEAISVIARMDLRVTDMQAVRRAATEAGLRSGDGAPEHLGEALYNLTAAGGIDQLMRTPGLKPVAALTIFTQQPDPFTGEELDEADLGEVFDLEDAPVLFAASDIWDGDAAQG